MGKKNSEPVAMTFSEGEEYGILLACKSFYYTYQQLRKQSLFAHQYESNEEKLARLDAELMSTEERPFLFPALATNGSLAAELALKYLVAKETGILKKGHYLSDLYFNQLPQQHRNALNELLFRDAHQNEATLKSNLLQYDKHFEQARYFYEKDAIGISGFFDDFVRIVCDYAITVNLIQCSRDGGA